jgi:hypothetical protein
VEQMFLARRQPFLPRRDFRMRDFCLRCHMLSVS